MITRNRAAENSPAAIPVSHKSYVCSFIIILLTLASPSATFAKPIDFQLLWPVDCQLGKDCFIQNYMDTDPESVAFDYQCGTSTYNGHTGTDIRLTNLQKMADGVEVRAASPGKVIAIRDGVNDEYLTDSSRKRLNKIGLGNTVIISHDDGWKSLYGHLKKNSVTVAKGDLVKAGTSIGKIGLSGLTEFPHLHFGIQRFNKDIDPFTGTTANKCGAKGKSLWQKPTGPYLTAEILDMGISPKQPASSREIESVDFQRLHPTQTDKLMVGWVRVINTRAKDRLKIRLTGPDNPGRIMSIEFPAKPKAIQFYTLQRPRKSPQWPLGSYTLSVYIVRNGIIIGEKKTSIQITKAALSLPATKQP